MAKQTTKTERLTAEEKGLLAVGRAAERFVEADRAARAIRSERNQLGQMLSYSHDDDEVLCFNVVITHVDDDGDTWEERQSRDEWCDACRKFADARYEAYKAYLNRRSARQSLTAAYRRLTRLREQR